VSEDSTPKKTTGKGAASAPKQAPLVPPSVPPGAFDDEPHVDTAFRTNEELENERRLVAPPVPRPEEASLKTGFADDSDTADLEALRSDDGDTLVTLRENVYEELPVPNSTRTTHVLKYAKGQAVPRKVLDAHKGRATEDKRSSATESK
jgi:hypothetical protein